MFAESPVTHTGLAQLMGPKESLWERLKEACAPEWDRYLRNEFVWRLADGSLDAASYRHWVEQDYVYCINYCRGYALAAFKSRSVPDMRKSITTLSRVLNEELELHRSLMREWGMSNAEIEAIPEASANLAYTRYVLDVGMRGDVLDLLVSLSICVIGYAEIGTMLARHERSRLQGNPYRAWIEQYAGKMFQETAGEALEQLDAEAAGLLTQARFDDLVKVFRQTLRLDIEFWDMALRREV
jgi:thiaminase/transcriptional activator TenA